MANGTRSVSVVFALVIGLAVGWFSGCSRKTEPPPPTPVPTATPSPLLTPTCPPAKTYQITVGPDVVSEKEALISSTQTSPVVWIAGTGVTNLVITFDPANFPTPAMGQPPFAGGQPNAPQVYPCSSTAPCGPQAVNSNLKVPDCPGNLYYKYKATWTVGSVDKQADAGIIIEK